MGLFICKRQNSTFPLNGRAEFVSLSTNVLLERDVSFKWRDNNFCRWTDISISSFIADVCWIGKKFVPCIWSTTQLKLTNFPLSNRWRSRSIGPNFVSEILPKIFVNCWRLKFGYFLNQKMGQEKTSRNEFSRMKRVKKTCNESWTVPFWVKCWNFLLSMRENETFRLEFSASV